MRQLRIAIGDRARQGKDTVASVVNAICSNKKIQILSFAEPLYNAYYASCRETGMNPYTKDRTFLQYWGDKGRAMDKDYWVNIAIGKIDPDADIVIITDLRYQNELEKLKNNGFYLWKVIRNDIGATDGIPNHSSEKGIPNEEYDFIILNNGTIADLEVKIREKLEILIH